MMEGEQTGGGGRYRTRSKLAGVRGWVGSETQGEEREERKRKRVAPARRAARARLIVASVLSTR